VPGNLRRAEQVHRDLDGGWSLCLDLKGTYMVDVAAPCTRAGAAAIAQLANEINAGQRGNPFRRA
jgi:hypothetical protein